jgi:transcriptional/translational regulatory protein YebC/TACO1
LLETEAEDYEFEEVEIGSSALSARVICDVKKLAAVSAGMSTAGFAPESQSLEYLPISETEVGEFDKAFKVHRLVSELESDDDIESVWHTAAISDEMVEKIVEAIESTRFRT